MASFADALFGRSTRQGQPVRPTGSIGEEAGGALRQLLVGGLTGQNPGDFRQQFAARNQREQALKLQDAIASGDPAAIALVSPDAARSAQALQGAQQDSQLAGARRFSDALDAVPDDAERQQLFDAIAPQVLTPEQQAAFQQGGPEALRALTGGKAAEQAAAARTGSETKFLQLLRAREAAIKSGNKFSQQAIENQIAQENNDSNKIGESIITRDANGNIISAITPDTPLPGGQSISAPQAAQAVPAPGQPGSSVSVPPVSAPATIGEANAVQSGRTRRAQKSQEAQIAELQGVRELVKPAVDLIGAFEQAKAIIDSGVATGPATSLALPLQNFLVEQNIVSSPEDLARTSAQNAFRALGKQFTLLARSPNGLFGGLPGAASDKDVAFLSQSVPGLANTPGGNRLIIDLLQAKLQRNVAYASWFDNFAQTNGRNPSVKDQKAWVDSQPSLVPDAIRAQVEALTKAQEAPQEASAARFRELVNGGG